MFRVSLRRMVVVPVVLDQRRHVLFRLNVQLFFALFVFEADFVEVVGAAAGGAAALDAALGVVGRERVGRAIWSAL